MICNKKRQFIPGHLHPILAARTHIIYPLEWTKTVLKRDIKGRKKGANKNRYLDLCHCFSLQAQSLELYHPQGRNIFYSV